MGTVRLSVNNEDGTSESDAFSVSTSRRTVLVVVRVLVREKFWAMFEAK